MRTYCLFFIVIFFGGCQSSSGDKNRTESIPFTIVEGYGPFVPSFGLLGAEDKQSGWAKTYESPKGIPENWHHVIQSNIWLDPYQFVYQHFKKGNIDKGMYESLQQSWKWVPDTTQLTSTFIRCFVYAVSGRDKNGKQWVIVDTNNNLDFSDEKAFEPEQLVFGKNEFSTKNLQRVHYDRFTNGEVVDADFPLVIKVFKDGNLGYNIPQHGKCKLANYTISFPRNSFIFERCGIVEVTENRTFENNELIEIDKYLTLGGFLGNKYKNKGVDFYAQTLQLESGHNENVYSFQNGYLLEPFKSQEFVTGKEIRTDNYKGKYLYIDFWGTWCRGCVQDIPKLVDLYQTLDKTKVEFVGIAAGESSPEKLRSFLEKHKIKWPQILNTPQNDLVKQYHIDAFPTTALIDPTGKIVQTNISAKNLKEILDKELK